MGCGGSTGLNQPLDDVTIVSKTTPPSPLDLKGGDWKDRTADLMERGRYAEAIPLLETQVKMLDSMSKKQQDTVALCENLRTLASAYKRQRDFERAGTVLKRALRILETEKGNTHPETLAAMEEFANVLQLQGRPGDAVPLYQYCLRETEKILRINNPASTSLLTGLGLCFRKMERYEDAIVAYARALRLFQNLYGLDDPRVAECRRSLEFCTKGALESGPGTPGSPSDLAGFQKQSGPRTPSNSLTWGEESLSLLRSSLTNHALEQSLNRADTRRLSHNALQP
eukprot:CAMPEP_0114560364 /NCGR_PEP_ID=MMETSP0114-20121206/11421_1 /TAXON_ID=31324 /ORGANISM="Goniomonas sp, Strain m" /LENGTH=283 /DNA_ID=CAMNT_0001745907 /DNA_START=77 /DNA_END=925 /DNA_ORIENTATION=-